MSRRDLGVILIVDDDADIRSALRATLEVEGYAVADAGGGAAALDYLRANPPPALIMLDWNMSSMDGPQFMIERDREPSLDAIPVVLLTADLRASHKFKSARFAAFLTKPVDLDRLFAVVAEIVGD